jgi:predicted amidophosphoribosyltransferase
VIAVPPAGAWRRARGFDPASLIAKELARRLDLPRIDALARAGRAPHQLGASRGARRAAGRVDVRVRRAVPEHVLLVDDVHTTGATLAACARALRGGGAMTVRALAYARTLG